MQVRKATKADIPKIKKIDAFGSQLNKYSGLNKLDPKYKPKGKSYVGAFITGKKKWCYVAEEKKNIIGFILFNIEKQEPFFKIKEVGYIDLLFVDKKARGKGISKLLMEKANETFKKEGIKHLKLSVHSDNPAHDIWKKHGFKDYRIDMWKKL